jgi:hypothetical protein
VALKKGDGWVEKPSEVKDEICGYFLNHFSEEEWDRPTIEGVVVPSLTWEEAGSLEVPFLEVEVKEIIDASHNNKSPGPNGFNFEFFSECWEVVKMDLMQLFQEFYFNARVPKGMLSYFIALIPKISNPHAIPNFRPISLLGSVYKVVAKVLASRLVGDGEVNLKKSIGVY